MDADQFRQAMHAATEQIIRYYDTLKSRPVVANVEPGYLAPQIPTRAPDQSQPWEDIQKDLDNIVVPGLTHWQHPNFMAFFPSNTSYPGILGELYSSVYSAPAFNWTCSPAITELETVMMDWVAQMINLPSCFMSNTEGGGVIQGTASEAVVTVMVAARERALSRLTEGYGTEKEREDAKDALRGKLVAIGSEHAHSSTQKGALIAGTKIRIVPVLREDAYGMRGAALRSVLEECRSQGLIPYYLTVTMGSTNTCAVDYFEEIAEALKDWPDVWVHVDAAYAGSALSCPEYQHYTKSFASFDSVGFNMHKWMLTNFDLSCLFIRKRKDLTNALSITPSYLKNTFSDSGLVTDYRDWQIPLGRRFRSLKVWFVLRSYGVEGIQKFLRNHIKLGEYFHSLIKSREDLFDVLAGPAFALTVINCKPRARRSTSNSNEETTMQDAESQAVIDANALTKEVYERVNSKGEVFLTSTVIGGLYAIRIVSANTQTEQKFLKRCFDILVETTEAVLNDESAATVNGA